MGANANPSGNQDGTHGGPEPTSLQGGGDGGGGGAAAARNPSNGSTAAVATDGNLGTAQVLKHNPDLSMEWSAEEQAILGSTITSGFLPYTFREQPFPFMTITTLTKLLPSY